ncbi:ankyrin repeat domain-containing protein, partial [Candidatus Dependentiae bacterium]|nr:ankyrin repeat domain-containing protein [Candidatus Dependentiae bacterium]
LAAYEGHANICEHILQLKPGLLTTQNNNEAQPIHEAIRANQEDMVVYLLQKGADPYVLPNTFHLAILNRAPDALEALLTHNLEILGNPQKVGKKLTMPRLNAITREVQSACGSDLPVDIVTLILAYEKNYAASFAQRAASILYLTNDNGYTLEQSAQANFNAAQTDEQLARTLQVINHLDWYKEQVDLH